MRWTETKLVAASWLVAVGGEPWCSDLEMTRVKTTYQPWANCSQTAYGNGILSANELVPKTSAALSSYCKTTPCIDFLQAVVSEIPNCKSPLDGTNQYANYSSRYSNMCSITPPGGICSQRDYIVSNELNSATPLPYNCWYLASLPSDSTIATLLEAIAGDEKLCQIPGCSKALLSAAALRPNCFPDSVLPSLDSPYYVNQLCPYDVVIPYTTNGSACTRNDVAIISRSFELNKPSETCSFISIDRTNPFPVDPLWLESFCQHPCSPWYRAIPKPQLPNCLLPDGTNSKASIANNFEQACSLDGLNGTCSLYQMKIFQMVNSSNADIPCLNAASLKTSIKYMDLTRNFPPSLCSSVTCLAKIEKWLDTWPKCSVPTSPPITKDAIVAICAQYFINLTTTNPPTSTTSTANLPNATTNTTSTPATTKSQATAMVMPWLVLIPFFLSFY